MIKVLPVPAFKDNYIWLVIDSTTNQCAIVDPGDAMPVIHALQHFKLQPIAILITHHHWDHTNGVEQLLQQYTIPVYGSRNESLPFCDHPLQEGDHVDLTGGEIKFSVLDIPGHTLGHIAFYNKNLVFTGDTLFTGGCGRIFEGTPPQMFNSLTKLAALPDPTLIYCGHEYTAANLKFALVVEPNNTILQQRIIATEQLRAQNQPTVPATLQLEKQTNPFLRTHVPAVIQAAEKYASTQLANPVEVFAVLREWKNNF